LKDSEVYRKVKDSFPDAELFDVEINNEGADND